jgi:SAM-dependent methyltransferase
VAACDPSEPLAAECAARHDGVDVRLGSAEALPFGDHSFDAALAQLVLHFVAQPDVAAREMSRVVRPGGVVGACVWDFAEGMEMLRLFWDSALAVVPEAPDEARTLRFGGEGEIARLFERAGLVEIEETTLHVSTEYRDFDELWHGFMLGVGPAGSFCVSLTDDAREAVRAELFARVGSPEGAITLRGSARCAVATVPMRPEMRQR